MRHYFFDSSSFLKLFPMQHGEEFWFASTDLRQAAAARVEGMPVLEPTA